MENRDRKI
jgi:sugar phosphate permease